MQILQDEVSITSLLADGEKSSRVLTTQELGEESGDPVVGKGAQRDVGKPPISGHVASKDCGVIRSVFLIPSHVLSVIGGSRLCQTG